MKRLTQRTKYGTPCLKDVPLIDVMEKLAKYEDAEEQSRLIQFPQKIGETVYILTDYAREEYPVCDNIENPITKAKIIGYNSFDYGTDVVLELSCNCGECEMGWMAFNMLDFWNNIIFSTHEQAEYALKALTSK